jgi:hypothetical protein
VDHGRSVHDHVPEQRGGNAAGHEVARRDDRVAYQWLKQLRAAELFIAQVIGRGDEEARSQPQSSAAPSAGSGREAWGIRAKDRQDRRDREQKPVE